MKPRSNTTFSTDTCDCIAQVAPASDCMVCALTEDGKVLPPMEYLPNATKMKNLRDLLRKP